MRTQLPDGNHGMRTVSVILACEVDAPKGVRPVQWRLLTNRERSATVTQAFALLKGAMNAT